MHDVGQSLLDDAVSGYFDGRRERWQRFWCFNFYLQCSIRPLVWAVALGSLRPKSFAEYGGQRALIGGRSS